MTDSPYPTMTAAAFVEPVWTPDGLSPETAAIMKATRDRREAAGLNIKYVSPDGESWVMSLRDFDSVYEKAANVIRIGGRVVSHGPESFDSVLARPIKSHGDLMRFCCAAVAANQLWHFEDDPADVFTNEAADRLAMRRARINEAYSLDFEGTPYECPIGVALVYMNVMTDDRGALLDHYTKESN